MLLNENGRDLVNVLMRLNGADAILSALLILTVPYYLAKKKRNGL